MGGVINIPAVFIANTFGILLLGVTLSTNYWHLKNKTIESKLLLALFGLIFLSCLSDPFSFYYDGKPGFMACFLIYASNTWLFFTDIVAGIIWVFYISYHLLGKIDKKMFIYLLD